jgi:hypothetical protein
MAPRTTVDPTLLAALQRKRDTVREEWLVGIRRRDSARAKASVIRVVLALAWMAIESLALWLLVLELVDAFDLSLSPTAGTLLLSGVFFVGIWTAELLGRSPAVERFISAASGGLHQLEQQVAELGDRRDEVEGEYFDTKYQPTPIER